MVTGGGVTAVRFSGVIKSDLGRKSGGTGCVCVQRIRLGDWQSVWHYALTGVHAHPWKLCKGARRCAMLRGAEPETNRAPFKLDKTVFSALLTSGNSLKR